MQNPEARLTKYLAKHGMKLTTQRRLILAELYRSEGHLSAEELYRRLRTVDSSIGQATVYRTLKLMREAGLARELHFAGDVALFEPRNDAKHHDHLICEACGKTLEVMDEEIEKLQSKLAQKEGFTLTSHRMYLYGLCRDCRKKNNNANASPA